MNLIAMLWRDETGLILSAEAVTVGTITILGAVVGLNAASEAVNAEMTEVATAIRSLDQSYLYTGHRSCRAWTAGSYFIQKPVSESVAEICGHTDGDIQTLRESIDADREQMVVPTTEPEPNQIPPKAKKKSKKDKKDED